MCWRNRNALFSKTQSISSLIPQGGSTFSENLDNIENFCKLFVNVVKAGELGGVLELVLSRRRVPKAQKVKNKVKSAMIYPVIVLTRGSHHGFPDGLHCPEIQ
jgi:type IV pilus assembly protein PilC